MLELGAWSFIAVVKMNPWLLLNSGPGAPAFNMALDEALLEAASRQGRPVLRFYGWTEPAATFGYFQKYADVERATPLRPLIRRPTGGGIVPHDADWTYSVAFPPGHEWHSFRAAESYRRVHEWIQSAFAKLNVATELAPRCKQSVPSSRSSRREEAPSSSAECGMRNRNRASLRRLLHPFCRANASPVTKNSMCSGTDKKSPARRNGATSWACSFKGRCSRRRFAWIGRIGKRPCALWGAGNGGLNGWILHRTTRCGVGRKIWSGKNIRK